MSLFPGVSAAVLRAAVCVLPVASVAAVTFSVDARAACRSEEQVIFQCPVKKKSLDLCARMEGGQIAGLQYRFGPADAPELQVPSHEDGSALAAFHYKETTLISGTAMSVGFVNGDTAYEVYFQDGKDAGGGVVISKGGKQLATVSCTGNVVEHLGKLSGKLAVGEATDKPDPLFGKSQKQICESDALLLLKYPYKSLQGGGFQKNCCVKGALGDDDRCNLDWPFSDVPSCQDVDVWRNELFALYGYTFSTPLMNRHFTRQPWYVARADFKPDFLPKVAQDNVALLKTMATKQQGCQKGVPGVAACTAAAAGFAEWAMKNAKGQMDGVQQGDIYTTVIEQCGIGGYSEAATACLAEGKSACSSSLTAQQAKDLRTAVKGIFPDPLPF